MPDFPAWVLSCLLVACLGLAGGARDAHARHVKHGVHNVAARQGRAARHHHHHPLRRLPPLPPMKTVSSTWSQHGLASWYGTRREIGHRTASGDVFDPTAMTAAHRQLPLGTLVRIRAASTGRSVIVRINDRGPYRGRRIIDLSPAAARMLGLMDRGTMMVDITALPPGGASQG
ncbi:septal ring lytic transglycosylase RlpA family lipoprotein [Novacetimonas maltaceti]|uniref:Endolytic peptidoglycan transglycosylase RlpA n=1 Tax=Novacetimonas maltaceti TaxID=1203393 RepID=A0A2S3W083_9PROT|nr:septal ring lytic transglycosylase RlpA family protein [Novacetimonas maltaceti]POF62304.1 rare lipoprotein A [Novacetimonas maltaceti]PYD60182.1 septal ring lytic transglycosylase RlpA family lipoprotein [Novacetimonas maltaceti]